MRGSHELRLSSLDRLDWARFWAQVGVRGHAYGPKGPCWPWRGSTDRKGYGSFSAQGTTHLAHRLAYAYFYDCAPADTTIRHGCDSPPCCQPGHLLVGTNAQNVADRVARNRGGSRLTAADVYEIRRLLASGMYQREVAARFGINQTNVSQIALRRTWHHLPEDPADYQPPQPVQVSFIHDPLDVGR